MSSNLKHVTVASQEISQNKNSIFDYITESKKYINENECFDDTPPFLSYMSRGIQNQNIDIENELRGSNKKTTKCPDCKFIPENLEIINGKPLFEKTTESKVLGKHICKPKQKIHPNGYFI